MTINKINFCIQFLIPLILSAQCFAGIDDYKFFITTKALYGNMGSENGTHLEKRKMNAIGIDGAINYKTKEYLLGLGAEYANWYQLDSPKNKNESNTQGNASIVSVVLGATLSEKFRCIGKYHFYSVYSLEKKNANSEDVTYRDPRKSFSLQLHYWLTHKSFWGIEYASLTYSTLKSKETEVKLSNDKKVKLNGVGMIYGFNF